MTEKMQVSLDTYFDYRVASSRDFHYEYNPEVHAELRFQLAQFAKNPQVVSVSNLLAEHKRPRFGSQELVVIIDSQPCSISDFLAQVRQNPTPEQILLMSEQNVRKISTFGHVIVHEDLHVVQYFTRQGPDFKDGNMVVAGYTSHHAESGISTHVQNAEDILIDYGFIQGNGGKLAIHKTSFFSGKKQLVDI